MYTVFFRDIILEQTDPNTGYEIDPNTGLLIDPDNGLLFEPQTGHYYNPQTMQLTDPATGEQLDPNSGEPIPPQDNTQQPLPPPGSSGQGPSGLPPEGEDPSAQQMVDGQTQQIDSQSIENVEKYIIYSKLLNLKYSLENSNVPNKDPKEFNDIIYHMTILLSFFDTFDKDQITQIASFLISRVNKLINIQEKS